MSRSGMLVLNAGSSSLKMRLEGAEDGAPALEGEVRAIGQPGCGRIVLRLGSRRVYRSIAAPSHDAAVGELTDACRALGIDLIDRPPVAVAHRVVHGGTRFTEPTLLTPDVEAAVADLADVAPLHQHAALTGVRVVRRVLPDAPQWAVFDTAFHAGIPAEATTPAVPERWREELGVRRFGFHGVAHASVARRVEGLLGRPAAIVTLHLGSGASACAVLEGRSVETSMGFSPLGGLLMATRSGDVGADMVLHVQRVTGMTPEQVSGALHRHGGLRALAGITDGRELFARAEEGDEPAQLAVSVMVHRIVGYVGAYAALMGRLDAVAFSGGVGEGAPALRGAVLDRLRVFGGAVDERANAAPALSGGRISPAGAPLAAFAMPADEEAEIARQCRSAMRRGGVEPPGATGLLAAR